MSHWHVRPVLVALGLVVAGSAAAQVPDSTRADSVPILPPIEVVGTKEGVEKAKELILAAVREGVSSRPARE